MIFFTADTHFGHRNIIKYCNRPFSSVNEMDEILIRNWNNYISPKDTIYHLGDFSFRPELYKNKLNGNIILIRGNHDKLKKCKKSNIFKEIHEQLILKIENYIITLNHYCMRIWYNSHFNTWHLYGHTHAVLTSIGKSHDVGVDNNDYRPICMQELTKIMDKKENNVNWVKKLPGYDETPFELAKISNLSL